MVDHLDLAEARQAVRRALRRAAQERGRVRSTVRAKVREAASAVNQFERLLEASQHCTIDDIFVRRLKEAERRAMAARQALRSIDPER